MADKDTYKLLDEFNENLGFDGLDLMVKEGLIEKSLDTVKNFILPRINKTIFDLQVNTGLW